MLDPFMGSGQTAIAALKTKRHFIGYEIDRDYVDLANRRIRQAESQFIFPKSPKNTGPVVVRDRPQRKKTASKGTTRSS